jgi:large subunit GTPase 1
MTPYEKNLEFWRQLWRVIERSDVIVQIVDARNPLLFYCADLEQYCKEISENKLCILLVNKSDYLTQRQRLAWLKYFENKNIRVVFWSAAIASQIEDDKVKERDRTISIQSDLTNSESIDYNEDEVEEEEEDYEDDEQSDNVNESQNSNKFNLLADEKSEEEEEVKDMNESNEETESDKNESESDESQQSRNEEKSSTSTENPKKIENNINKSKDDEIKEPELTKVADDLNITEEEKEKCKIFNSDDLINLFKTVHKHIVDKAKPGYTTVGLVGYPNVGKSSTINALIRNKKVAVSETPGKTKHYQTIFLDEELMLCDCPGLVFPSFVSTRGELIINGILPIDQMRDYVEPINLLIHHIPKNLIEMFYGIELPKPKEGQDPNRLPSPEELCSRYSCKLSI